MSFPNPIIKFEHRCCILLEALEDKGVLSIDFKPIFHRLKTISTVDEVYTYVYQEVLPSLC